MVHYYGFDLLEIEYQPVNGAYSEGKFWSRGYNKREEIIVIL
jgi:hypothetical protein